MRLRSKGRGVTKGQMEIGILNDLAFQIEMTRAQRNISNREGRRKSPLRNPISGNIRNSANPPMERAIRN